MDAMAPIEIEKSDHRLIYKVSGTFDANAVRTVRTELEAQVDEPCELHIIDMSETVFLDSSGIGAIVFLYKRLAAKNKRLVMTGLSGQPADLIKMLRIDKVMEIKGSIDDVS